MSNQPEDETKETTSFDGAVVADDDEAIAPPQNLNPVDSAEQTPETVDPLPGGGQSNGEIPTPDVEGETPELEEPVPVAEPPEEALGEVPNDEELVDSSPEGGPSTGEIPTPGVEGETPESEEPVPVAEPPKEAPGEVPNDDEPLPDDIVSPAVDVSVPPDEKDHVSSDEQTTRRESELRTTEFEGNDAVLQSNDGAVPQGEELTPTASESKDIFKEEGDGEAKISCSGTQSRRPTTESELQKLTTADIVERLQKSYEKACRTLTVIANIQRKDSILKLEDHKLELIKKFKTFEGHLEQLGLVTEMSTQTAKAACECKSVPSEDLAPPTPQDNLPQVIICGREEQVPKIIVCESSKKNKKNNRAQLERERLLKTQKELVLKCEFMNEKLMFKETIIASLHKQIRILQNENNALRRQLAKSNPKDTESVCLAYCPLHCRPKVPGTNSQEPIENESTLAHKDSTSQESNSDAAIENGDINVQSQHTSQVSSICPGSVCTQTCPSLKCNVPGVDSRRSSKEDSQSLNISPENQIEDPAKHVCPKRCPYSTANADGKMESRENSITRSISPENQSDGSAKHVCPQRCTHSTANADGKMESRENSITRNISPENQSDGSAKHVCPQRCPYFKSSADGRMASRKNSTTRSVNPENQPDGSACPSRCPYFKPNLPVVKEESSTSQPSNVCNENQIDSMEQHVCSMSCPYFKESLLGVKEETQRAQPSSTCKGNQPDDMSQHVCPAKFQSVGTDKEIENLEIEIPEPNLVSTKDTVPRCECVNGETMNTHIIMRLCNDKTKPKELTFGELKKAYTCLKLDFSNRMVELENLRKDIVKHKEISELACVAQQRAEIEAKNISEILKSMQDKNLMMMVPKERMMEMEQQIVVAKERFLESQDELEELRELTQRQTTQLEDYRSKYLQSHEQVEDQKGQIEMLELENSRISENVALEIQHVKNQFEVRLQALAPLPDVLKATQEKLQELQQQQELNERKYEEMEHELLIAQDKVREYAKQLDDSITSSNMEIEGQGSVRKKFTKLQSKYHDLQDDNAKLKKTIEEMEEIASNNQIRLTEKLHEVAQLAATLEMLRVESARQVSRAKERLDSVRDALQGQIIELEKQVAESRAIARTARKDRENIRQRMQSQIDSLHESFEQAQVTIRTLQEQIGFFNDTK